jgi:hypothetical protein
MPAKTLSKKTRKKAEGLLTAHGVDDYTWIDPRRIITAQWVRMKCVPSRMSKTATVFS